ncbi:MAG: glycosyltransferase family 4 protein [Acidimicrobiales bacterium]|nr:glycosyltransferase family 4 protein [Acidimicrobiales bacterium]
MRILHLITDTDRRGAQVFATHLARALDVLGHTDTVVALTAGTAPGGLDVVVLGRAMPGEHHRMQGRWSPATLRALRRAMFEHDITVAHGSSTLLACAIAGGGRRRPFVYRQVSDPTVWAVSLPRRVRVAAALRRARLVVALADATAAAVTDHLRVPPDRVRVIPNGFPGDWFAPATEPARAAARARFGLTEHDRVVATVGSLAPEKRVAWTIEAATAAGARLLVAGDGPERDAVRRAADDTAVLLGQVDDVRPVYAAADVVVLASATESMPGTLIEAGLSARPVVATRVGAVPEIVVDAQTGRLVDADDRSAFVAAVADLLDAPPATRAAFGAAARQRCIARFDLGTVARLWADALGEAVAGVG